MDLKSKFLKGSVLSSRLPSKIILLQDVRLGLRESYIISVSLNSSLIKGSFKSKRFTLEKERGSTKSLTRSFCLNSLEESLTCCLM